MKQIILLHGALGSSEQLKYLSEALSNEGFSVFTLNFSGHGGEPFRDTFSIEQFSDELRQYIDRHSLRGTDIFGYSMGGYVALLTALTNPGYCGKVLTLGTKFDWSAESAEAEVRKLDPVKIELKVPKFAALLRDRHKPNDWKELLQRTASMMRTLGDNPILTSSQLKQINNEVLIAIGDGDDTLDRTFSEHVAASLPGGAFTVLGNTTHPIERVDVGMLTRLIIEFTSGEVRGSGDQLLHPTTS